MDMRKNVSLILGLSIPILMILFITASIYWPKITVHPKFNFLYVTGENYYPYDNSQQQYLIQEGKLVIAKKSKKNNARFYIYDIAQHNSKEIFFQDAKKLNLDINPISPDGFEMVTGGNDGGIFSLFFGTYHNYHSRYLKGHHAVIKLNIANNYHFRFLGWIKP